MVSREVVHQALCDYSHEQVDVIGVQLVANRLSVLGCFFGSQNISGCDCPLSEIKPMKPLAKLPPYSF